MRAERKPPPTQGSTDESLMSYQETILIKSQKSNISQEITLHILIAATYFLDLSVWLRATCLTSFKCVPVSYCNYSVTWSVCYVNTYYEKILAI
ncbi:hypothetical protein 010DV004_286 [Bacillus phage 010DV004]|nr:hypothetical protein 010DV004_21 [Bacillus phage 010DV004]QZA69218.1 hypothetical protein 010DV004_286 [Bacillus phage 010DV004]QZA69499.1 hypothetical protein 010DV005_287 [Bacillus phage 010DV005]QZA69500.1 hypothetical protein 010DV005_21 [Bacillus phage 010DV005]